MEGFEELQRMYREALPEKHASLEREWQAIRGGAEAEPHAQALRRQLHQLSGSAGAYGYEAMGELARDLEKAWVAWLGTPAAQRPDANDLCTRWQGSMQDLLDALWTVSLPSES